MSCFASQVFYAGGVPMQLTGAVWYGGNGNPRGSTVTWIRVRDFRSHWYQCGSAYIHIEGRAALTAAYSPALIGMAYVFDGGENPDADNWEHTAIEDNFANGHDWEIQHSYGEIVDWRKWYYTRTAAEKVNMDKPGHGIRLINP